MDNDQFLSIVQQMSATDRPAAEAATAATLQTLAERLPTPLARRLVDQLPPEIGPLLFTEGSPEKYDADTFVARVSERLAVDVPVAERQVRSVLSALARAITPEAYDAVVAELPDDFAPLLPRGPWIDVMPTDEFVRRVAEGSGVDNAAARAVTDAVLETLAERIAAGEVDDLITRLPGDLHPALQRGRDTSPMAMHMSLDKFIDRVATREGIDDVLTVREHARAVFLTLREAVGDEEFFDVTVQLPPDYDALWAR
jgi:uncharacterized protein (DUF2267 family)